MSQTTTIIGISPEELRWILMLVALPRHSDPALPELTRQALLYLSRSAGQTAVPRFLRPCTPAQWPEF